MRVFLIIILLSSAALAADTKPQDETGPNFNLRRELPNPLPADFNECVLVVWSDEMRQQRGKTGGFYYPPLERADLLEIEKGRALGWGTYSICEADDS